MSFDFDSVLTFVFFGHSYSIRLVDALTIIASLMIFALFNAIRISSMCNSNESEDDKQ